jgi:hypothetical protein
MPRGYPPLYLVGNLGWIAPRRLDFYRQLPMPTSGPVHRDAQGAQGGPKALTQAIIDERLGWFPTLPQTAV